MLGIRCFKDCKVDLWVGPADEFAADQFYSVSCEQDLKRIDFVEKQHAVLIWQEDFVAEDGLRVLRAALEKSVLPRRLTCLLASRDGYMKMREALELLFEDLK
ncbi:MAG: hypothetical protein AB8C84_08230 [Oligoflexales bacterium]